MDIIEIENKILDMLKDNKFITPALVRSKLGVSYYSADSILNKMAQKGSLKLTYVNTKEYTHKYYELGLDGVSDENIPT